MTAQTVTLFRPVGLHELALLWDSGMREFPPRLPHQPIFYPVANKGYARQIASTWNINDEASGFAGLVMQFDVQASFLSAFELHVVGSSEHAEYWIPTEQLSAFNQSITALVRITDAYFGSRFIGWVPEKFGFRGKNAVEQFVAFVKTWDYSRMDFACEASANQKAVFLNFAFWAQHDFSSLGINRSQRDEILNRLRLVWEHNKMQVPLPTIDQP